MAEIAPRVASAASGKESRAVRRKAAVSRVRSSASAARATASAATLRTAASAWPSRGRAAASRAASGPIDRAGPGLESRGDDSRIPVRQEPGTGPRTGRGRPLRGGRPFPPVGAGLPFGRGAGEGRAVRPAQRYQRLPPHAEGALPRRDARERAGRFRPAELSRRHGRLDLHIRRGIVEQGDDLGSRARSPESLPASARH